MTVLGNRISVTLSIDFSIIRSFLGPKNCHCSRIATLTGVTITDKAYFQSVNFNITFNFNLYIFYTYYQGGTVSPVTLRELMSHALHFLMTSVTPKYEF